MKELIVPAVLNETTRKYLHLLLDSERCAYETICINSNNNMMIIFKFLTQILKKSKVLKKLELVDLRFDLLDLHDFPDALTNCNTLRSLKISESTSYASDDRNDSFRMLMRGVAASKSILHLTLNLSNDHDKIIWGALNLNRRIKKITLHNHFENNDFLNNSTIETVEFSNNSKINEGLKKSFSDV